MITTKCTNLQLKSRKSEDEIHKELKEKGKYDEWVSLGSYYGLTSDTLNAKLFLQRPYKYYNIDGEIVNVSMIQSTYRSDVDNIAVFKQLVIENPTHVEQKKYKIVDISENLSTFGLATCSALIMIIGRKKFLSHLDAVTNILPIINDLNKTLLEQKLNSNNIENIKIYVGDLDHSYSLKKAIEICEIIGI
jgi:hypothetical protein